MRTESRGNSGVAYCSDDGDDAADAVFRGLVGTGGRDAGKATTSKFRFAGCDAKWESNAAISGNGMLHVSRHIIMTTEIFEGVLKFNEKFSSQPLFLKFFFFFTFFKGAVAGNRSRIEPPLRRCLMVSSYAVSCARLKAPRQKCRSPGVAERQTACSTMTRIFETITSPVCWLIGRPAACALYYCYTAIREKRITRGVWQVIARIAADTSEQENHPFCSRFREPRDLSTVEDRGVLLSEIKAQLIRNDFGRFIPMRASQRGRVREKDLRK